MPRVPFPEYAPDLTDNETQTSKNILNVYPQADGYGPVYTGGTVGSSGVTATGFSGTPTGMFAAKNADGTYTMFASSNSTVPTAILWKYAAGTWSNVNFIRGPISTSTTTPLTIINAGTISATSTTSGQTYTNVAVVGGSGTSAKVSVVVSSLSGVTSVVSTAGGTQYLESDYGLTCASSNIGNVTGFSFAVTALATSATTQLITVPPNNANWTFAQFNQTVIATQQSITPQKFLLGTSNQFQALGASPAQDATGTGQKSSPPAAAFVSVISQFVILSGIVGHGTRIQWCDLDNIDLWTPGIGSADFQDLPDGGNALGVAGFDLYGVAFQEEAARLLTFVGGGIVFQITKIAGGAGNGLFEPYAFRVVGSDVFWVSPIGIKKLTPGGVPEPIGKERVDRTLFSTISQSNNRVNGTQVAGDPLAPRVFFAYPSTSASTASANLFDTILVYDYVLNRWSKVNHTASFIASVGSNVFSASITNPGNPGALVNASQLGYMNSDGSVNAFSGASAATLESVVETAEQGNDLIRGFVRGFRAISDAPSIFGSLSFRENPMSTYSYSTAESTPHSVTGIMPFRVSTRYSRAKVRIPATTAWTYIKAIDPDLVDEGEALVYVPSLAEKNHYPQNVAIQQLSQGSMNAAGMVTLSATGATQTVVPLTFCSTDKVVMLTPQNQAAANSTLNFVTTSKGFFTLFHSSSTTTDVNWGWACLGP